MCIPGVPESYHSSLTTNGNNAKIHFLLEYNIAFSSGFICFDTKYQNIEYLHDNCTRLLTKLIYFQNKYKPSK